MADESSFSDFIGDFGTRSWVVLFAEADVDQVRDTYASIIGVPAIGPLPTTADTDHFHSPSGGIVALADSDWTIVFHRVGVWAEFDSGSFSKKLNARLVAYEAEDTSGSTQCTIFEPNGESKRLQISADAKADEELMEEMAEYADEMGIESASPDSADQIDDHEAYLRSLGISLVNVAFTEDFATAIIDAHDVSRVKGVFLVRSSK